MRTLFTLTLASFLVSTSLIGQRLYSTSEFETQFSYAAVQQNGTNLQGVPRFSYPNIIHKANLDFGKHFGLVSGLSFRNTGFIYKVSDNEKFKHRLMTLGVPLGIKIGGMQRGFYVALGGEMEMAINYKEKHFLDGEKTKFNEWFSGRTELFNPSLFAGARLNGGESAIYLRYYPKNFFNTNYAVGNGEQVSYPYRGLSANTFTLTFAFNLDCNCGCAQSRSGGCHAPKPIPVEPGGEPIKQGTAPALPDVAPPNY